MQNKEKTMITEFLDSLPKGTGTRKHYLFVIDRFKKQIKKSLDKITQEDLLKWKKDLERKEHADKTISNYISVLRLFLKYHYGSEAVRKIRVYQREFRIKEVPLTLQIIKQMYKKTDHIRDELILRLFAQTGVRLSELLGIRIEDIDFENKTIKLVKRSKYGPKGGKERFVGLFYPKTIEILKEYIGKRTKGRVFSIGPCQVQNLVREYAKKVGLNGVTTHSYRHFFAMQYLNAGGRIEMLQKLLGHSSLITTSLHLSYMRRQILEESQKVIGKIGMD